MSGNNTNTWCSTIISLLLVLGLLGLTIAVCRKHSSNSNTKIKQEDKQTLTSSVNNDPEKIHFKKMVAVARDVRGPYIVRGSHKHGAQQVILSNGYAEYNS
jgi:hypothetical protein